MRLVSLKARFVGIRDAKRDASVGASPRTPMTK
jgi:hypothetical protein